MPLSDKRTCSWLYRIGDAQQSVADDRDRQTRLCVEHCAAVRQGRRCPVTLKVFVVLGSQSPIVCIIAQYQEPNGAGSKARGGRGLETEAVDARAVDLNQSPKIRTLATET